MKNSANASSWADAIARRAGSYGLGIWLESLSRWLGDVNTGEWMPENEQSPAMTFHSEARGTAFTLKPVPGFNDAPGKRKTDFLALDNIVFDGATIRSLGQGAALPLHLALDGETPESIARKVGSTDTSKGAGAGANRTSYFLDDGRVVEVTVDAGKSVILRVLITKLWLPVLFRG